MNTLYKIIIAASILFIASCDNPFNPGTTDDKPPVEYKPNDTPENLLDNLKIAYQTKDIDLYEYCLADDFRFQLISTDVTDIGIDVDNDGIPDSEWGYQQEIEYHNNLFVDGSSDGSHAPPDQISLNFTATLITDDNELGHENWVIVSTHFELQLHFNVSNTMFSANGNTRFYLRPNNNEWEIAIWRDESNVY